MSAATTGAQAVYNKQSLNENLNNQLIALRASRAIYINTDRYKKDTLVSIASFHYVTLITGQVSTEQEKQEIGSIVKHIPDVQEVYNFATIGPHPSALTQINDAWITTKIKSSYIANGDIDPSHIKVITENGVVYLMGILPHDEADTAVQIARTTDGVGSVVKIFSYIRISKT